jgi:hypothetical protein
MGIRLFKLLGILMQKEATSNKIPDHLIIEKEPTGKI